jgi:hypothetical protein
MVAAVVLGRGTGSNLAKTYGEGHYTVWGQPRVLASQATVVHRDDGD